MLLSPANDRIGVLAMVEWRNWTGTGYDCFGENGSIPGVVATDRFRCTAGPGFSSYLPLSFGGLPRREMAGSIRPIPAVHQNCQTTIGKSKAALRFRRKLTFVFDTRISGPVIQRKKSTFQTGGRHCSRSGYWRTAGYWMFTWVPVRRLS